MPRNVKGLPHTQYRTHGNYGIIIRNHAFQLEEETFSVRTVTLKRQHTTSTAYYTKFYLKIIILVRLCLNVSRHPKFTFLFCAQKTEIIYLVYVKKIQQQAIVFHTKLAAYRIYAHKTCQYI
jgi:hypothetical protein